MSILTGPEIRRLAEGGTGPNGERITIDPFDSQWCQPNSFDVHLGDTLRVYDLPGQISHGRWWTDVPLDPENPPPTVEYRPEADGRWLLWPGRGYLGSVVERIESHGLVPDIDGRSSCGRYFVTLHQTAGRGDDGWGGHFTCEIVVTQPTYLRPGARAAQIRWTTITGERKKYQGRYQHQPAEPVASRFHLPDERRTADQIIEDVRAAGGSDWDRHPVECSICNNPNCQEPNGKH